LRGDDPMGDLNQEALSRLSLGEVKDYFNNRNRILDNKNIYEEKKRGMDYKDEVQMLKNKKHLIRLQNEDTDEQVIELLKVHLVFSLGTRKSQRKGFESSD
jgi:hypothetical protein